MGYNYEIEPKPTKYNGINFRSRLEAKWCAFFDIAGLKWEYEPIDLKKWTPDFYLEIPCSHSECVREVDGKHELYIEVKPVTSNQEIKELNHPVKYIDPYSKPHPAIFGINPDVTVWEMTHGSGPSIFSIKYFVHDYEEIWKKAVNKVKWKAKGSD